MALPEHRIAPRWALKRSLAITLAYVAVGAAWILLSDAVVGGLSISDDVEARVQSLKGVFFVLVTSSALFLVLYRMLLAEARRTEAVQAQEMLFENIINDTPDLMCRFRPDGTIIHANAAYEAYFGVVPGSLTGKNLFTLVDPADVSTVRALVDSLAPENPIRTHEHRVLKDGKRERWQRWTNRAVVDPTGRVDEIQAIGQDITAEVRVRNEREKTLALMPAFLDALPGIGILTDESGQVVYSNRAAQTVLGRTADEFLTRGLGDLFDEESVSRLHAAIGELSRGNGHARLEILARKNGGEGVTLDAALFPVPMMNTRTRIGIYGVDMTYARTLEQAVSTQQEQYKQLFDLAEDAIVTFRVETDGTLGGLLDFNTSTSALLGYSREELLSISPFDLVPEPDRKKVVSNLAALARSEQTVSEYTLIRKDGSRVPVELSARLFDEDGAQRAFCIVRDLTARRKTEDRLRESEERYHAIFESAGQGIVLQRLDDSVEFVSANPMAERLFGVGPGELTGRSPSDFSPEFQADGTRSEELHRETYEKLKAGISITVERLLLRANGEPWTAEVQLTPTRIDGKPYVIATFGDISQRILAQERLTRSEAALRRAQAIARIASWEMNISTREIMTTSDTIYDLFGIEPGDLKRLDDLMERVHPEDRDRYRAVWAAAETSGVYENQYRVIVNGEVRWMYARADLTKDAATGVITAFGATQDITRIKDAEQAVATAQHRLEIILGAAPVGIGIESGGMVTWASEGLSEITGIPVSELANAPMTALFEAGAIERFKALKAQSAPGSTASAFQTRIATRDDEECWVQVSARPLDTDGSVTFSVTDVTEDRKNEQRMIRLSTAVERSPVSIIITDVNGIIQYVNPETLLSSGYSEAELIGQHVRMLGSGETPTEYYAELWKTISRGESWRGEFHNKKKSGELYWEQATIGAIRREGSGETTSYISFKQDISRRKALETELKQYQIHLEQMVEERTRELDQARSVAVEADRMKSTFLASISHELRTPLTSVIGFGEILQEQSYGTLNEKQHEFVDCILASAQQLLGIVSDILDLSKLDAGRMALSPKSFTLPKLISHCIETVSTSSAPRGIGIQEKIDQNLWLTPVVADERKLRQALLNLLANAVKFTPDNGTITVQANVDGDRVRIAIDDTGVGIAPEHLEDIFEEFKQLDNHEHHHHKGTGLGLALTRRIVDLHGGRVWAESPGRGQGSTFHVEFPLKPREILAHAEAAARRN